MVAITSNDTVEIRPMGMADLAGAHRLSQEQHWAHRAEDWSTMLALGDGVVAECKGAVVGTTMWWKFGDHYACIGLVIVSEKMQGRGIGRRLMKAALDTLGDRNALLNATDEGLKLYESLGFEAFGHVSQHQGADFAVPDDYGTSASAAPVAASELGQVATLDGEAYGYDRNGLPAKLAGNASSIVIDGDHGPCGYAMLRPFGRGYAIGPVVAADTDQATRLIAQHLHAEKDQFCRIDVVGNPALSKWLESIGLPKVGQVTQMCRGERPPIDGPAKLFALVNQAIG